MSQPPPPPPAGWYPDPSGAQTQRYFDGTRWTELLAPLNGPIPPMTWPAAPMHWPAVQGLVPPPKSAVAAGVLQLLHRHDRHRRYSVGPRPHRDLLHPVLLHRHSDPGSAVDLESRRRDHDVRRRSHRWLWPQAAVTRLGLGRARAGEDGPGDQLGVIEARRGRSGHSHRGSVRPRR